MSLVIIFLSLQILHNKELNHLVSVCSESVIRVWEVESGKQVSQVTEPHGPGVEVTCVAFHKSGYRMATGALDGRSNHMVLSTMFLILFQNGCHALHCGKRLDISNCRASIPTQLLVSLILSFHNPNYKMTKCSLNH